MRVRIPSRTPYCDVEQSVVRGPLKPSDFGSSPNVTAKFACKACKSRMEITESVDTLARERQAYWELV